MEIPEFDFITELTDLIQGADNFISAHDLNKWIDRLLYLFPKLVSLSTQEQRVIIQKVRVIHAAVHSQLEMGSKATVEHIAHDDESVR